MLNSLILEGWVADEPSIVLVGNRQVLRFTVKTERLAVTEEGERVKEESHFPCEAYGVFTEEKFKKWFTDGQGIRLVGRLKQTVDSNVCIVCEHIEWKLGKKK
jgi:single-stranded DNA-binding protein